MNMASNAVQLGLGALAAAAVGVAVILLVPGPERATEEPPVTGTPDATAIVETPATVATETADVNTAETVEGEGIETAEVEATETVGDVTPEQEAPSATVPSILHLVMSPDGFGTVSGKGDPAQVIEVLVAGEPVDRVETDNSGNFASVLALDPSPQPRRLTLLADPDGARIPSEGQFFVQPIMAAVAEVPEVEAEDTPLVVGAVTPVDDAPSPEETPDDGEGPIEVTDAGDTTASAEISEIAEASAAAAEAETSEVAAESSAVLDIPVPMPLDLVEADAPSADVQSDGAVEVAEAAEDVTTEPVATPETPTIIVADNDGVRVLQDNRAPEVMSAIALDTITYDPTGEVILAGRAAGEGFVRVYVDNRPVTTSRITDGGWQTDLPEVDTGVYTLRIDEVDAEGTVVSRIETPFKREEPDAVAAVMAEDTQKEGFDVAVRTVQPGATLWAIAREEMGEGIMYVAVYEANKDLIKDPDLIFPGQVFRIPQADQ